MRLRVQPGVCVWGCFSGTRGTGNLSILPPKITMRKEEYLEVLETEVVPTMEDHGCSHVLEDKAPCHTANVCKDFKRVC